MKNIVITGACGGIGSHLVPFLLNNGWRVVALDDLSSGSWENLEAHPNLHKETLDVSRKTDLKKFLKDYDFQFCIHLAATSSLPECQQNPIEAMKNNFLSTVNISEVCSDQSNFKNFIFASTSAVYEGTKQEVLSETDHCDPYLVYPLTKHMSEKYLLSMYKTRKFPVMIARLFNVFGDYQNMSRKSPPLLNYLVREIVANRRPVLYGWSAPKRDYISVDTVVNYLNQMLTSTLLSGKILNVCSGIGLDVKEIYSIVSKTLGTDLIPEWRSPDEIWSQYHLLKSNQFPLDTSFIADETNKLSMGSTKELDNYFGESNKNLELEIQSMVRRIKFKLNQN